MRAGCLQSELSPDGQYLACLDKEFALELVEVASGKDLASKKDFFQVRSLAYWFLFRLELGENANLHLAHLGFSPDGRYLFTGNGNTTSYQLEVQRLLEAESPTG